MNQKLNERLYQFALHSLKMARKLPETTEFKVIKYQLIKSTTSAGANYEESQAGSSLADFNNKIRISLREMKESNYWFRLISDLNENETLKPEIQWLNIESVELSRILGSIVQKTRSSKN